MDGLRAELRRHARWAGAELMPLPDTGLAHVHIRLVGSGLLARIPKQSQLGLLPLDNLQHQRACFERAAPSGHTPRCIAVLPPGDHLPRGALLVQEITGRPAALPADLQGIARALAALHALALPPAPRAPLPDVADPLQALLQEIGAQAVHLDVARLAPGVQRALQNELETLAALARRTDRPVRRLIAFDTHPGNFIVRATGEAVLVDLEKCRYSYPGLDLAHATLYTSTTWDTHASAALSCDEVAAFYVNWERAAGDALAATARAWHAPLRRAMWLWSLTWCCQWRALADAPARPPDAEADWSAAHSDAALVRHVRERVDHYLSAPVIARVRHELDALQKRWAA